MPYSLPRGSVYQLPPIDWWPGWSTVEQAVHMYDPSDQVRARAEVDQRVLHAQTEFDRRTYWEGDIVAGPYVSGIPTHEGDVESDLIVAIKQSNNGSVFVWSPYELPWLKEWLPEAEV